LSGLSQNVDMQGNLSMTNVPDLLQFLHASRRTGELRLNQGIGGKKAAIFFELGELVQATTNNLNGIEALAEVLGWESGKYHFYPDTVTNLKSLDQPLTFLLMEAARLRDETRRGRQAHLSRSLDLIANATLTDTSSTSSVADINSNGVFLDASEGARESGESEDEGSDIRSEHYSEKDATERSDAMAPRSTTDVLEDLLKVPGIDAVVIVGRDGFVIESSGATTRLNLDSLGAALAHAVNSIEEMGGELHIDTMQDMFIEYGRAVILCRPVADAIATLVAPDASKLGIIRHKAKPLFDELAMLF
jgi:predicted regulator of Ras-like GTPase activity (Roadblock/LC7/MglB family)